jgi:ABC-2 type transport system ATP-binding protein
MDEAIRTTELHKLFGRSLALDGLDLSIATGGVHGFLGPNGAGKTTTLRLLLGLLYPDSGEAYVLGADPWRDAVELHRRLSYVPGEVSLWPNLTGGEAIDVLTGLRGGTDRRRVATALADQWVTSQERQDLHEVAVMLGIDVDVVESMLAEVAEEG